MKNKAILIFPPAHDFAMPYMAPAYLKSVLNNKLGGDVSTIDLNSMFFNKLITSERLIFLKKKITYQINNNNKFGAIEAAINLEKECDKEIANNTDNTLKTSIRKITMPYNQLWSHNIYNDLQKNSNFSTTIDELLTENQLYDFNVFCLTVAVEDQIVPTFTIANLLKKHNCGCKIILGGAIATRLANEICKSPLVSLIDFIVLHEAENSLPRLLKFIWNSNPINNLSDPKIISAAKYLNGQEEHSINWNDSRLEKVPFFSWYADYSNYSFKEYLSPEIVLPINATRKCYWGKCEFCAIHHTWDPFHRRRQVDDVIDEITYYSKKLNIRYFRIVDEDVPPDFLYALVEKLIDSKLKIYFEIYCRFEKLLLDKIFCDRLYKSGCRQIFFGLENIGEETQKMVNKGLNINKNSISKILSNTYEAGICNYLFLLFGIPNTPVYEEIDTLDYIISNKFISTVAIGTFLVDKFSPIHLKKNIQDKYCISLFNKGDMTTEVGYLYKGEDVYENLKKRTHKYLNSIYSKRPDLAISSLINEETRMILVSKFGNKLFSNYANKYQINDLSKLVDESINLGSLNRIQRKHNSTKN